MKTIIIDGVEYNLTQKVAFREGDWVVSPNGVYWHIDKISNNRYEVTSNTGESSNWPLDTNIYHKFTIQDAKDGDVLANNGNIILFKQISDSARPDYKFIQSYCFVLTHRFDFYLSGTYNLDDGFHPATKEQRELLFQKMKEEGYKWNADKKELKKFEQNPLEMKSAEESLGISSEEYNKIVDECIYGEQKPVDSTFEIKPKFKSGDIIKEKKTGNLFLVNSVEDFCYTLYYKKCNANGCTMSFKYEDDYELVEQKPKFRIGDTIKKESTGDIVTISEIDLKNREYRLSNTGFIPFRYEYLWELVEQKPAWSEEDESWFKELELMALSFSNDDSYRKKFFDWLKSLKDRVQPRPEQEWSEEDEKIRSSIINFIRYELNHKAYIGTAGVDSARQIEWLKSLSPQNTWKPSDEQMESLKLAIYGEAFRLDELQKLYDQLKAF